VTNENGNTGLSSATTLTTPGKSSEANYFYTQTEIKNQQASVYSITSNSPNSLAKVYEGVSDSDDVNNNSRDDKYRLHYSGDKVYANQNTLDYMANQWLLAIYGSNNSRYDSYDGTTPKDLVKLESISQSGNTITLTYENVPNASYYFVESQNGVYNGYIPGINSTNPLKSYLNTNVSNRSYTFNLSNLNTNTILSCYVKVENVFLPGQPFSSIPIGQAPSFKILEVNNDQMNVSSQAQNLKNSVFFENVTWSVASKPSWVNSVTLSTSGDDSVLDIAFSSNTANPRNGQIILQETGGSISKTINITQSGSTSITTSLTSLNPTNSSSEWQGYGTSRFNGTSIDGNVINIGGTQYTQGIGTHANSRIVSI
jgi:hypothetical protein